jgi:hypothetical protein
MQLAKQLCFTIPGLPSLSAESGTTARPGGTTVLASADICAFRTRSDAGAFNGSPGACDDNFGEDDAPYDGVNRATTPPNLTREPSSLFPSGPGALGLAAMLRRTTLALPN